MRLFEIGITLQARLVKTQQKSRFFHRNCFFSYRPFNGFVHAVQKFIGVELNILEHFTNGIAANNLIDVNIAVLIKLYVNGVGVAQKIVQVAENFLICPHQKDAEEIIPDRCIHAVQASFSRP